MNIINKQNEKWKSKFVPWYIPFRYIGYRPLEFIISHKNKIRRQDLLKKQWRVTTTTTTQYAIIKWRKKTNGSQQ